VRVGVWVGGWVREGLCVRYKLQITCSSCLRFLFTCAVSTAVPWTGPECGLLRFKLRALPVSCRACRGKIVQLFLKELLF